MQVINQNSEEVVALCGLQIVTDTTYELHPHCIETSVLATELSDKPIESCYF